MQIPQANPVSVLPLPQIQPTTQQPEPVVRPRERQVSADPKVAMLTERRNAYHLAALHAKQMGDQHLTRRYLKIRKVCTMSEGQREYTYPDEAIITSEYKFEWVSIVYPPMYI